MKHLEVRQKYSAARRIFNSLLAVSSGDETLRLMFDILPQISCSENVSKRDAILAPVTKQWIAKDIPSYGSQSKRAKSAVHWIGK